jgi:hypothetical protein
MIFDLKKLEKKLSKMQRLRYNSLAEPHKKAYLISFVGFQQNLKFYRKDFSRQTDNPHAPKVYGNGELIRNWRAIMERRLDPSEFKRPINSKPQWAGVEIECFIPFEKVEPYIECVCECSCSDPDECGGECIDMYCECHESEEALVDAVRAKLSTAKIKDIQVVEDGSLDWEGDRGMVPVEIKVLINGNDFSNLEKVCEWINSQGGKVNDTCGLHVHLDARYIKTESELIQLCEQFKAALPIMNLMVPLSRVENTDYCRSGYSLNSRYYAINGTAWEKHRTLEIRLHSGTTDYTKIKNWITLLRLIQKEKALHGKYVETPEQLFEVIHPSEELKTYILKRIEKFEDQHAENEVA